MSNTFAHMKRAIREGIERNRKKAYIVVETDKEKWEIFSPNNDDQAVDEKDTVEEAVRFSMEQCNNLPADKRPEIVFIILKGSSVPLKDIRAGKDITSEVVNILQPSFFQAFAERNQPITYYDVSGYKGEAKNLQELVEKIKKDRKEIARLSINYKD